MVNLQGNILDLTPIIIHHKMVVGGGYVDLSKEDSLTMQQLLFPNSTTSRGTIIVCNLLPQKCSSYWQPFNKLPCKRPYHSLDIGVSPNYISWITQYCQFPINAVLAFSTERPDVVLTTQDLHNLISHGQPTNDSIIYLFLEIFCSFFNYTFPTEKFFNLLERDGWSQIRRYFSDNKRSRGRSTFRPNLREEQEIAIPCFIDGAHWIA